MKTSFFQISFIQKVFIYLLIYSPPSTWTISHWFLEDGVIKHEGESMYTINSPGDLTLFMSQTETADELRALQKQSAELFKQQDILKNVENGRKNQERVAFYADPDCRVSNKKLSQFDLYLSSYLRLEAKNIYLADFLDYSIELPETGPVEPFCTCELEFSMHTYDHLSGVAERHKMPDQPSPEKRSPIPEAKDLPLFGHRIYRALEKNTTSWILLNFAAIYFRISGKPFPAIECLRRALHHSPREHKDLALVNMANILHRSKYSLDAAILMHAALESTSDYDIIYFTLGNIYGALGQFDLADICYKYVYDLQPGFEAARVRMHAARCEHNLQKITNQIEEHQKKLKETVEGLEELASKQKLISDQQKQLLTKRSSPLQKYDLYTDFHTPYYEKDDGNRK